MPALILRVLTLVALVLMPFGMSAAIGAQAQHAPEHAAQSHCDDQRGQPAKSIPDQTAGCTAACSMLIADHAEVDGPVVAVRPENAGPIAKRWTSHPPETATPPPKPS